MALLSKNTHRELEVQVHYDFNCISEYTLRFYQVALIGEKSLDLMITEFYKLKVYFMIPYDLSSKASQQHVKFSKLKYNLEILEVISFDLRSLSLSLSLSQKNKNKMNVLFSLCLGVCLLPIFFCICPNLDHEPQG
jgi:hypothetical protein